MSLHRVLLTLRRQTPLVIPKRSSTFPSETEEEKEKLRPVRKLKKWRAEHKVHDSFLRSFNLRGDDAWQNFTPPEEIKPGEFKSKWRQFTLEALAQDQRFILERHQTLGYNLAVAHFVMERRGKVRQKDCTNFLGYDDIFDIPSKYDPNWLLEEVDLSNSEITYAGMVNFQQLRTLTRATFQNCKYFDDWCLERLVGQCPNLEYIDVSGCKKITERGVEGLYRTWKLKKLIVTDFRCTASFELTCLLLEDCLPDLKIEILKAPELQAANDDETY